MVMFIKFELLPKIMRKGDWEIQHKGWWCHTSGNMGVALESDGKWHSYIDTRETVMQTPGFKTMIEAMKNAEKRWRAKDYRFRKRVY